MAATKTAAVSSGTKRKIQKNYSKGGGKNNNNKKSKTTTTNTKELSSSAQRRILKHERQSHRRHADIVLEAKNIWNKLRLKTNTKEQVKELEEDLLKLLLMSSSDKAEGTLVGEIALQHDASRVVQAAIQFATTPEQRLQLTQALSSQMVEISKNPYAHFCVLKVIQYGHTHDATVRALLQTFKGNLCKLSVHAVGARVIEMLFSTLSSKQTRALRQEYYGPHFSLFNDNAEEIGNTLAENLKRQPQHEAVSREFLYRNILSKGMEKNLYGFGYFQQLLWEYVEVLPDDEFVSSLLSQLSEQALHLISTRAGTKVVMRCIARGTAKDRRKIMKALKGYARSSLMHRDAYLAILQLILVTDDTVTLHRLCLAELLSDGDDKDDDDEKEEEEKTHPLMEFAIDENASKLFLMLLISDDEEERRKYLDPLELEVLETTSSTSKKDPELRRKELVTYLTPALRSLCTNHASELSNSIPGTKVLLQAYKCFDDDDDIVKAYLDLDVATEHAVEHYFLQHVIACKKKTTFADALWKQLQNSDGDVNVINSRQAFVILSLFQQQKEKQGSSLSLSGITSQRLQQVLKTKKAAKEPTAGIEALLKFIDGQKKPTEKKPSGKKPTEKKSPGKKPTGKKTKRSKK
mmetsp:Transcript_22161/g.25227  ORF Transcript_22161/g.25227 Transcript_22161/m.25227 type:complete len:635 (-) Transcript_22161:86-1990(-)